MSDLGNYLNLAKYYYWNNNLYDSWFWKARNILWLEVDNIYNKRAFTFLASWKYFLNDTLDKLKEVEIDDIRYNREDIRAWTIWL